VHGHGETALEIDLAAGDVGEAPEDRGGEQQEERRDHRAAGGPELALDSGRHFNLLLIDRLALPLERVANDGFMVDLLVEQHLADQPEHHEHQKRRQPRRARGERAEGRLRRDEDSQRAAPGTVGEGALRLDGRFGHHTLPCDRPRLPRPKR
jgi:hypothetical protein